MRSIVTILSFILLCIQLSAQEKIEALKLISDICEKNISIDDFKKQYSDYFIINHDTDSTDSGLFILQNLRLLDMKATEWSSLVLIPK